MSPKIESESQMSNSHIGVIGLGTMGAALSLNIADKGFDISVFNRTAETTKIFVQNARRQRARITATYDLEAFVQSLARPRNIILMVPAGQPVDDQIAALIPLLDRDDMVIDAGNANFHDTNRRHKELTDIQFLGIGVSGGEEGARFGPSIMGGGARENWDRVAPILEAISAKYNGQPCATWMGPEGAGHFVKMVHNGIEYADMQMIAEIYGIMRDGLKQPAGEIARVFDTWNQGTLRSYLVDITAEVLSAKDRDTDQFVVDLIVDAAGQKGTGRWTVIEAEHLAAPVPSIQAAVNARNLSARKEERARGETTFEKMEPQAYCCVLTNDLLELALIAGKILCYAQGFEMLAAASKSFGWKLPLPEIARVWRAGCIIRSDMLDLMADALTRTPERNLILDPGFHAILADTHKALRKVVAQSALAGLPTPALSSGLSYFDTMTRSRGTANLIQAQRDFFGRHGFSYTDGRPQSHGPWAADKPSIKKFGGFHQWVLM